MRDEKTTEFNVSCGKPDLRKRVGYTVQQVKLREKQTTKHGAHSKIQGECGCRAPFLCTKNIISITSIPVVHSVGSTTFIALCPVHVPFRDHHGPYRPEDHHDLPSRVNRLSCVRLSVLARRLPAACPTEGRRGERSSGCYYHESKACLGTEDRGCARSSSLSSDVCSFACRRLCQRIYTEHFFPDTENQQLTSDCAMNNRAIFEFDGHSFIVQFHQESVKQLRCLHQ